jgi:hypothetical protein
MKGLHVNRFQFARTFGAVVLLLTAISPAHAATPPAGSPLARREHPRLLFTQNDLPALRQRIATLYRSEFQTFLDLLGNPRAALRSSAARAIEPHWGMMNYAFAAALDPQSMKALGFSFPAAFDDPQELCAASMTYVRRFLPAIAEGGNPGHDQFAKGYPDAVHLPTTLAYDWCYPHLSAEERTEIAKAFVDVYKAKYEGKQVRNMGFGGNAWLANNQNSAVIQNLLGIAAFWGDAYPDAALQQSMFDAFHGIWIDRLSHELNTLYSGLAHWHEGAGYFEEGFLNLALPLAMIDSAYGGRVLTDMPFFAAAPRFVHAVLMPNGGNTCGPSGDQVCPVWVQRFGEGGVQPPPCKSMRLMAGMLRTRSARDAALAKASYLAAPSCGDAISRYGGVWSNGVLFSFLLGDRDVDPAASGAAAADKLGLGHYVYRNADSRVTFFGQPFLMYGHGMNAFGHFTIHKYGDLILTAGNSKSGDASIGATGMNVFMNTLGIHKGANDGALAEDGGVNDPAFASRGLSMPRMGRVKAEASNPRFNYVFFDGSARWRPSTADVDHREMVYLKGPENSEYVVLFDRVRVSDPAANDKIWKVWVPSQPRFIDGTVSSPQIGKLAAAGGRTVEITNQLNNVTTRYYSAPPTHGRLFLRALAPDDAQISALGGPLMEFQDGNADGKTPQGAPEMSDAMRAYLGWGRVEIRPGARRSYDTFLTLMQFGDSHTLSTMAPSTKLRSIDQAAMGLHIGDVANEWVVMFSEQVNGVHKLEEVAYVFRPTSASSSHLLVNMVPGRVYYVTPRSDSSGTTVQVTTAPRAGGITATASPDGVLHFELSGSRVVAARTLVGPRNLRVPSGR